VVNGMLNEAERIGLKPDCCCCCVLLLLRRPGPKPTFAWVGASVLTRVGCHSSMRCLGQERARQRTRLEVSPQL